MNFSVPTSSFTPSPQHTSTLIPRVVVWAAAYDAIAARYPGINRLQRYNIVQRQMIGRSDDEDDDEGGGNNDDDDDGDDDYNIGRRARLIEDDAADEDDDNGKSSSSGSGSDDDENSAEREPTNADQPNKPKYQQGPRHLDTTIDWAAMQQLPVALFLPHIPPLDGDDMHLPPSLRYVVPHAAVDAAFTRLLGKYENTPPQTTEEFRAGLVSFASIEFTSYLCRWILRGRLGASTAELMRQDVAQLQAHAPASDAALARAVRDRVAGWIQRSEHKPNAARSTSVLHCCVAALHKLRWLHAWRVDTSAEAVRPYSTLRGAREKLLSTIEDPRFEFVCSGARIPVQLDLFRNADETRASVPLSQTAVVLVKPHVALQAMSRIPTQCIDCTRVRRQYRLFNMMPHRLQSNGNLLCLMCGLDALACGRSHDTADPRTFICKSCNSQVIRSDAAPWRSVAMAMYLCCRGGDASTNFFPPNALCNFYRCRRVLSGIRRLGIFHDPKTGALRTRESVYAQAQECMDSIVGKCGASADTAMDVDDDVDNNDPIDLDAADDGAATSSTSPVALRDFLVDCTKEQKLDQLALQVIFAANVHSYCSPLSFPSSQSPHSTAGQHQQHEQGRQANNGEPTIDELKTVVRFNIRRAGQAPGPEFHQHRLQSDEEKEAEVFVNNSIPGEPSMQHLRRQMQYMQSLANGAPRIDVGDARAASLQLRVGNDQLTCDICAASTPAGAERDFICWEHNHANGWGRGWACCFCNVVMGSLRDDPVAALRAVVYNYVFDQRRLFFGSAEQRRKEWIAFELAACALDEFERYVNSVFETLTQQQQGHRIFFFDDTFRKSCRFAECFYDAANDPQQQRAAVESRIGGMLKDVQDEMLHRSVESPFIFPYAPWMNELLQQEDQRRRRSDLHRLRLLFEIETTTTTTPTTTTTTTSELPQLVLSSINPRTTVPYANVDVFPPSVYGISGRMINPGNGVDDNGPAHGMQDCDVCFVDCKRRGGVDAQGQRFYVGNIRHILTCPDALDAYTTSMLAPTIHFNSGTGIGPALAFIHPLPILQSFPTVHEDVAGPFNRGQMGAAVAARRMRGAVVIPRPVNQPTPNPVYPPSCRFFDGDTPAPANGARPPHPDAPANWPVHFCLTNMTGTGGRQPFAIYNGGVQFARMAVFLIFA